MEVNTKNMLSYVDLMKDLFNFNGIFNNSKEFNIESAKVYFNKKCVMDKSKNIVCFNEKSCYFIKYTNLRIFRYNNEKNIVGLYSLFKTRLKFVIIIDLDISELKEDNSFIVKDITKEEYYYYTDIILSFTKTTHYTICNNTNFSCKVTIYNDTVYDFYLNNDGYSNYFAIDLLNKYGDIIGGSFFKLYSYYENYISLMFNDKYYILFKVKDKSMIDRLDLETKI